MGFLSARVKIFEIPRVNFELSQFLFNFCIILHCHDTYFPCKFWAHKFCTLDIRIPSKIQFLHFQTCSGEGLLNFLCHNQFSFKYCINIQYHQAKIPYTSFSSTIIYFVQKKPVKVQIFEIFECSGQNSSNASCQFWNGKSVPLQISHHSSVSLLITPL